MDDILPRIRHCANTCTEHSKGVTQDTRCVIGASASRPQHINVMPATYNYLPCSASCSSFLLIPCPSTPSRWTVGRQHSGEWTTHQRASVPSSGGDRRGGEWGYVVWDDAVKDSFDIIILCAWQFQSNASGYCVCWPNSSVCPNSSPLILLRSPFAPSLSRTRQPTWPPFSPIHRHIHQWTAIKELLVCEIVQSFHFQHCNNTNTPQEEHCRGRNEQISLLSVGWLEIGQYICEQDEGVHYTSSLPHLPVPRCPWLHSNVIAPRIACPLSSVSGGMRVGRAMDYILRLLLLLRICSSLPLCVSAISWHDKQIYFGHGQRLFPANRECESHY